MNLQAELSCSESAHRALLRRTCAGSSAQCRDVLLGRLTMPPSGVARIKTLCRMWESQLCGSFCFTFGGLSAHRAQIAMSCEAATPPGFNPHQSRGKVRFYNILNGVDMRIVEDAPSSDGRSSQAEPPSALTVAREQAAARAAIPMCSRK